MENLLFSLIIFAPFAFFAVCVAVYDYLHKG